MSTTTLFQAGDASVCQLASSAQTSVQTLLEACDDYAVMLTDKPHGAEAAADLFAALPPGREPADKLVLGIMGPSGDLIGILDTVRGYPEPGVWFLGLLLLHPAHRGSGLGAKVYEAFAEWAFAQGCDVIRLGVVRQNERGLAFWTRQGFQEVARQPMQFAGKDTEAVIMQDVLVADPE
jgi:GNAT superfamily N-acetyltransferase